MRRRSRGKPEVYGFSSKPGCGTVKDATTNVHVIG